MTFFGETIRKAREAKGLTTSQVADRTHILVQIIEAMEREDFKRIPAAIYGRGFVRHISEVLEIDPKPLVAEFMEIYEGRKPPASSLPDPFQPVKSAPAISPIEAAGIPPADKVPFAEATSVPPTTEAPFAEATSVPPTTEAPFAETANVPPVAQQEFAATAVAEVPPAPVEDQPQDEPPAVQPAMTQGLDLFDQVQTPPPAPVVQRASTRTLWTGNDIQPVIAEDESAPSPAPAPTPSPAPVESIPPATRAQDIFSSAYSEPPEEVELGPGPSAAEKFRESLSVVSHGVIGGVRKIPRSAWRMAVLVVGAITVIGLLIWGCKVLYRITEQPAGPETPTVQPTAPAAQPAKATTSKIARPTPAAPVKLRSTGQKVPPLYVD